MRKVVVALAALAVLVSLAPNARAELPALSVTSAAFEHEGTIPVTYACDGENVSPPLSIADAPTESVELVLIMDDPDAPSGTRNHWLVYNIAPVDGTASFPEDGIPAGALQGTNTGGQTQYRGPCPPVQQSQPNGPEVLPSHRYFFHVYALGEPSGLAAGADAATVRAAIEGKVIAEGTLMGRYACSLVDCLRRNLPV